MRHSVRGFQFLGLLVLLAAVFSRPPAATAQPVSPETAVAAAVARLDDAGYSVTFRLEGSRSLQGEMRYATPLAYGLVLRSEDGAALEYIVLDFSLYSRATGDAGGDWSEWERRDWHPDVPVGSLQSLHPRLPLELLRAATALAESALPADDPRGRQIDGHVSFSNALYAAYEDQPRAADPPLAPDLPLSIVLDQDSGRARRLALTMPPSAAGAFSGVATFEFGDATTPLEIRAPANAIEVASPLEQRPAPEQVAQALPLQARGDGEEIESPPFTSTGWFLVTLVPGGSGLQYQA